MVWRTPSSVPRARLGAADPPRGRPERRAAVAAATAVGDSRRATCRASSVLGTILSFHLDAATGPCIVVVQAGFFLAALAASLRRSARLAAQPQG